MHLPFLSQPSHWKEAFETKCLKVNLGKTNVIVSGGITKEGLFKSKVDPCGVRSLQVKAISILCVKCGKWIHGRYAGVKMVTAKIAGNSVAENDTAILER